MNLDVSLVEVASNDSGTDSLLKEVLTGLSKSQKTIHPKFLYDKKGSEIFEEICTLPEYYPTRVEKSILQRYASEIAECIGSDALIIEPGSGSGEKVRYLLPALKNPKGYVPIEISREILLRMTGEIIEDFPHINIFPVNADFTEDLELPLTIGSHSGGKVVFFPGSTIGNLHPDEAIRFLHQFSKIIDNNGGLLIGVDLKKDKEILDHAYNDSKGITAAFNLNLLHRMNRELDATFNVKNFFHEAFYNESLGRIEMHLKSRISQLVRVHHSTFRFQEGETIHTENSYKYSVEEFCELCAKAQFKIEQIWMDDQKLFCVYYFVKA